MDGTALLAARVREVGVRRPGRKLHHAGSTRTPETLCLPPSDLHHVSAVHELVSVAWGRGRVETPQQSFDLGPGELLLLAPGVEHIERPAALDCPYGMLWCMLDNSEAGLCWSTYVPPTRIEPTLSRGLLGQTNLETIAFTIASELSHRPLGWHEAVCALLRYLSCALVRRLHSGNDRVLSSAPPAFTAGPHAGRVVQAALDYCREHSRQCLTVQGVAAAVGYSASYVSHLFSACIGSSLADYLRELRLTTASELLETTDLSVAQIARDLGYSDPSHFTHAFTRAYQVSPRVYRRRST